MSAPGEPLNELLQCSVCIDVFTDPRTLPCLHTFCYKCIADWCKDTQPGGKATCPQCREEFVIPDSGIDCLKKNFFVANLLSMNDVMQKTEKLCEICDGEDKKVSEMFCLQCEQSYCESCSKAHLKMKISCSHELVRLEKSRGQVDINKTVGLHDSPSDTNVSKKYLPKYCEKHTGKLIELYCLDDEVAICLMCCVLDHRSHHCEEAKIIANQLRSGKWKQDLQTALDRVEDKLRVLDSRKLSFFDQIKSVESYIYEEADRNIQLIQNHKKKLVCKLEKLKAINERELDRVNQKLTQAKALLTMFTTYCEKLFNQASDVDICREKKNLCRRTEELINTKNLEDAVDKLNVTDVTFSPSISVLFGETNDALGEFASDQSDVFNESENIAMSPIASKITSESGMLSESEEKSMSPVTSTVADNDTSILRLRRLGHSRRHGIKTRDNLQLVCIVDQPPTVSDGRRLAVTGVTLLKNFLYVIYEEHNKVQVFECEARVEKIKDIQVNVMENPYDMVGCSVTSHLFISESESDVIFRVNLVTEVNDVFIRTGFNGGALSLMESRLLVTTAKTLLVYDIYSGQEKKSIPLTGVLKTPSLFSHAIESNRDSFFVIHEQTNDNITISEMDSEGRVLSEGNEHICCAHLALDSVGCLILADCENKRIVLLDEHLQCKRILLDEKRMDNEIPWKLNYSKFNNRLAVGLVNGQVRIFDFNHFN